MKVDELPILAFNCSISQLPLNILNFYEIYFGLYVGTAIILIFLNSIFCPFQDWVLLKEHIVTLCKRRGHFKLAITKMIQRCCEMVGETSVRELGTLIRETHQIFLKTWIVFCCAKFVQTLFTGSWEEAGSDWHSAYNYGGEDLCWEWKGQDHLYSRQDSRERWGTGESCQNPAGVTGTSSYFCS